MVQLTTIITAAAVAVECVSGLAIPAAEYDLVMRGLLRDEESKLFARGDPAKGGGSGTPPPRTPSPPGLQINVQAPTPGTTPPPLSPGTLKRIGYEPENPPNLNNPRRKQVSETKATNPAPQQGQGQQNQGSVQMVKKPVVMRDRSKTRKDGSS